MTYTTPLTCMHKRYLEIHIGVWKETALAPRFPQRPGTHSSLMDLRDSTASERRSSRKVNLAVISSLSRLV
jgi:hypothetical protein